MGAYLAREACLMVTENLWRGGGGVNDAIGTVVTI